MKVDLSLTTNTIRRTNSIERIIVKYRFHPSILIIKNKISNTNNFRFEPATLSDIQNESKTFNPNTVTTHNNIPPKILRQNVEATVNTFQLLFNVLLNRESPEI